MATVTPLGAILLLLLAATGGLVLAPTSAQTAEEPHATDPEGDARETSPETALGRAQRSCSAAYPVTHEACAEAAGAGLWPPEGAAGEAGTTGLVPAPPSLDVVAGWFEETPTDLRVVLQVAQLDEALTGLAWEEEAAGGRSGALGVGWRSGADGACGETLWLSAEDAALEHVGPVCGVEDPTAHPWGGGCNAWWWCTYEVETEVLPGTPGRVVWTVPRDMLYHGEAGASLEGVTLFSWRSQGVRGGAMYSTDILGTPASPWGDVSAGHSYVTDRSEPGRPFVFQLAAETPTGTPGTPHYVADRQTASDPRLEILSVDVVETPEILGYELTLADVEADAGTMFFWGAIGLPDGHVVDLWVAPEEGERLGVARYGVPYHGDLFNAHAVVVSLTVEVEPGTPGKLRLLLDRAELPAIHAGGPSTLLVAMTGTEDQFIRAHAHQADPVASAHLRLEGLTEAAEGEYTDGMPRYRFQHDTPEALLDSVLRFPDASGDARLPAGASLDPTTADHFDITYLETRADGPEATQLTMGIRDLSSVEIPPGYHAAFYAFGLEAAHGATMVGYYKDQNDPAGAFFCAADTSVLAEAPRDPTQAVWTLIEGHVTVATGGPSGGGSGGPGSLTFLVPDACLGVDQREPKVFDRFEAATFLVQNIGGRNGEGALVPVDEARVEGPVTVPVYEPDPVAPAGWYQAPLGVENFWDILGIALAGVVATGGAMVKLRRRRISGRAMAESRSREGREVYREALERAVHANPDRDVGGDEVLVALRDRFNISQREHALLELEVRSAAGLAAGALSTGALFLGKYRVGRELGEGGFARTYLARDEKLGRDVVLKVARWEDPREAKRALQEARVLAKLDHPHIVRVLDVEEVAGQTLLVLEHLPGGSLADRLREGPLAQPVAVQVGRDVGAGLAAAHAAGIIHRDVKPGNILFTSDGRAKLADFGIAVGRLDGETLTGSGGGGTGAGTLRYMAPEQARGLAASAASDRYSLGVVLYEMLTGDHPLDLAGLAELDLRMAILEDPPRLPVAGIPAWINDLLARLLDKEPTGRPKGHELAHHLGTTLEPGHRGTR